MSIMKIIKTKEELLAMSPDDYMNNQQLDYFERFINDEININYKRIAAIESEIQSIRELTDLEEVDRIQNQNDLEFNVDQQNRCKNSIKKLEAALIRIANSKGKVGDDKEFGYCQYSGDEIGLKRLLIDPTILLTIEEQQEEELKKKQFAQ